MKWNFLYQITAATEPLTKGLPPPDPRSLCPLSSTEFVEPPPNKIPWHVTVIISFTQDIYTYIPETNYVSREYSVAAILLLLFMVLISLVPVLNL